MLLMSDKIIIRFSKVPTASLITWINKWMGCFVHTKTRGVGRFQDEVLFWILNVFFKRLCVATPE